MKLLPFDPLPLAEADIQTPQLNAKLIDNQFHAAHDFTLKDLHFDLDNNILSLNFTYTNLIQTGKYNMRGRLLAFQLNGNGNLTVNYSKFSFITSYVFY